MTCGFRSFDEPEKIPFHVLPNKGSPFFLGNRILESETNT
jgi:hypothetical protein